VAFVVLCTCLASSRVGASTMTAGALPKGRRPPGAVSPVSVWTMGRTKARVLPHPVLARPTRSVPASSISSVCACKSEADGDSQAFGVRPRNRAMQVDRGRLAL